MQVCDDTYFISITIISCEWISFIDRDFRFLLGMQNNAAQGNLDGVI